MRWVLAFAGAVVALALGASAARCDGCAACGKDKGCHQECVCEQVCNVQKPVFRLEVSQEKYTVSVPVVPPAFKVATKVAEQEQPCTQYVPVCVVDPCTGCTRTELKPETVVKKVKVTVVDITPNQDCPPPCKVEERVRSCFTVTIDQICAPEVQKTYPCAKGLCGKHIPLPPGPVPPCCH